MSLLFFLKPIWGEGTIYVIEAKPRKKKVYKVEYKNEFLAEAKEVDLTAIRLEMKLKREKKQKQDEQEFIDVLHFAI